MLSRKRSRPTTPTSPLPALAATLALTCLTSLAMAQEVAQPPNWDTRLAKELAATPQTVVAVDNLKEALLYGPPAEVRTTLESFARSSDLSWPAREAVLNEFAMGLHRLTREDVPADVMAYLSGWEARTLVPFEEHPAAGTPLFNISGTTGGVENHWRRIDGTKRGREYLTQRPDEFTSGWSQETDRARRRGYLDSLRFGSPAAIETVRSISMGALPNDPDLTAVAAYSSLAAGDIDAIETVVRHGSGSELRPVLTAVGPLLYTQEATGILEGLVDQAPDENTALAIGAWSRPLAGQPMAEDLFVQLLDHPTLGGSAALALSVDPSSAAVETLVMLAAEPNSLAGRRAELALEALGTRDGEPRP